MNKIIVALDVPTSTEALALADELVSEVGMFKVGLELLTSAGVEIVRRAAERGLPVFFDEKFHDIPNTVAQASRAVVRLGASMYTVHATGGCKMMEASLEACRDEAHKLGVQRPLILAVTVLTSIDQGAMNRELGVSGDVRDAVVALATRAADAGLDGVIASPEEVAILRKSLPRDMLIVTPGVRPTWAVTDDQKRVMTPADAVRAGATHVVIGRPITRPPSQVGSPLEAARLINRELAAVLEEEVA